MSGWSVAAWSLVVLGRPVGGAAIGVGSATALIPKLPALPATASFRLAALGNLRAGSQIARAVRRVWWPIVAVLALRSRVARRTLALSLVSARRPLRLVDDVAYSIGVWRSLIAARTIDPLVPSISSWPGRASRTPRRPAGAR